MLFANTELSNRVFDALQKLGVITADNTVCYKPITSCHSGAARSHGFCVTGLLPVFYVYVC
jgi:hypothetical protein